MSQITEFIVKNSEGNITTAQLLKEYMFSGTQDLFEHLIEVLQLKSSMSLEDINSQPRSTILNMLYQLGCPQMYAFHKTAVESTKYGTQEHLTPNPLVKGSIFVATDYATSSRYIRRDDVLPHIMAFPLEDVLETEDRYLLANGVKEAGSQLEPMIFPLRYMTTEEFEKCTSKLKIFSFDPKRYEKMTEFLNSLNVKLF